MACKLNLSGQTDWDHHRSGWRYALNCLKDLHNENGIHFEGWLDGNEIPIKPFVGFFHCVPNHPQNAEPKYRKIKSLNESIRSPRWKDAENQCRGIFTVSAYLADFLKEQTNIPICSLIHPTEFPKLTFDLDAFQKNVDPQLVIVGHWMRKFESLYQLQTHYKKCILKSGHSSQEIDLTYLKEKTKNDQSVFFINHLDNDSYDMLLSKNIVFLDLHDVGANNTIIDCIARNTPCLVNRLPGTEDYLGKNYPFYFSCLEEASSKLNDASLIKSTTEYLKQLPIKKKMTGEAFRQSIVDSQIYQDIQTWNKIGVIKLP